MNKKVNKHTTSKAKLTNTLVDRMPLPVKIPRKGKKPKYTSVVIWDETVPGFYVRKTVSGTATFYLFYRDKERRTKILKDRIIQTWKDEEQERNKKEAREIAKETYKNARSSSDKKDK